MELNKLERYLRVNLLGPGPRLIKKRIYWTVVSQRLRNTAIEYIFLISFARFGLSKPEGANVLGLLPYAHIFLI